MTFKKISEDEYSSIPPRTARMFSRMWEYLDSSIAEEVMSPLNTATQFTTEEIKAVLRWDWANSLLTHYNVRLPREYKELLKKQLKQNIKAERILKQL